MHETAIAKKIIEKALEQVGGEENKEKIESITIEVGDLGHLPADEMAETLKTMVKYEVKVVNKKATVKCACGYEGEPKIIEHGHDFTLFECPECGKVPEVLDGKDIKLIEVKVKE